MVPARGRVLDLACGDDAPLRERLGARVVGIDLVPSPLGVQGRAQALPFADGTFDAAVCHLAFMLFDDLERVVAELARVLRPQAPFIAVLGGGPTADGDDAFHAFARLLPRGRGFGDRRASSDRGWRELFDARAWRDITFERVVLDLGGTFDDVWTFLGSSYQLDDPDRVRAELRESFPGDAVPLQVATYWASVIRR